MRPLLAVIAGIVQVAGADPIQYQPAIVVDDAYIAAHGSTVTGNFAGITIATSQAITITKCNLSGTGTLISGSGVNARIVNNRAVALNPNVYGQQKGMFINFYNVVNLTVENNTVEGASFGVYINGYIGNVLQKQTIHITNNVFKNTDARPSDGKGGYFTSG